MKTAGIFGYLACIPLLCAGFVQAAAGGDLVRAEIVPETLSVRPDSSFTAALRLEIAEGWHIYWKNPGDAGLPTRIEWILPDGVEVSKVLWPVPQVFDDEAAVTFGYEGSADLLVEFKVFCGFADQPALNIEAHVEWLACKDGCIPGNSWVERTVPVMDHEPEVDSRMEEYFHRVRAEMPQLPRNWRVAAAAEQDRIILSFLLPEKPEKAPDGAVFFPENDAVIDHGAPQLLREEGEGYRLLLKSSPFASEFPSRLRGVLFVPNGWGFSENPRAVFVNVPLNQTKLPVSDRTSAPAKIN